MGTNTQEAVLSAYITSVGKRTPREAAQDAAELCRLSDLADSSHELERSSRNPLAVTGGMPLCIHSERSACITSTRAARAAGSHDATTAAVNSTNAERTTGRTPGIFTSGK